MYLKLTAKEANQMKELLQKIVKKAREIVWIKLTLDIFTALVILYLIVQFFLHAQLGAPLWMVRLYKIILTTFVFSHEAARWISGHGRDRHYSWYFDHGEIYVSGWILATLFLWIMQGILNYPDPELVIDLTIWVVGAYAGSRISKEASINLKKFKSKKS